MTGQVRSMSCLFQVFHVHHKQFQICLISKYIGNTKLYLGSYSYKDNLFLSKWICTSNLNVTWCLLTLFERGCILNILTLHFTLIKRSWEIYEWIVYLKRGETCGRDIATFLHESLQLIFILMSIFLHRTVLS